MKKLVFMFAAIVAVSFASCGNKTQNVEVDNDSVPATEEVDDSLANDSLANDSLANDSVK